MELGTKNYGGYTQIPEHHDIKAPEIVLNRAFENSAAYNKYLSRAPPDVGT